MIRHAALVLVAACGGKEPLTSCRSDLAGTWLGDTGERWMIIGAAGTYEVYPLFDDTKLPGVTFEVGPRAIDLTRDKQQGEVRRRFGSAGTTCIAKAPVHLVSCAGETLELVLADPAPPISFTPCAFGRPAPSHRERWTRE